MKILHSYLHKKGGEKVHKAIQEDSGESGKAIVSTGSPGPKNIRVVQTKLITPT